MPFIYIGSMALGKHCKFLSKIVAEVLLSQEDARSFNNRAIAELDVAGHKMTSCWSLAHVTQGSLVANRRGLC